MICAATVALILSANAEPVDWDLQFLQGCPIDPPLACAHIGRHSQGVFEEKTFYVVCFGEDGEEVYDGIAGRMIVT